MIQKDLELFLNQQQREIETICKTLPNANNSKTFVDVLRSPKVMNI